MSLMQKSGKLYQLLSFLKSYMSSFLWIFVDNTALRFAKRQLDNIISLENPFFIVLTPGCLHLFEKCLAFIPPEENIVLFLNGLDRFERNWVKTNLGTYKSIVVKGISNHLIEHGKILDLIFDTYQKPFGIIDYDCFVFDQDLFKEIKDIKSDSMINAIFLRAQGVVEIPGTFFLYFNTSLINQIKAKYSVDSRIIKYQNLSDNLKRRLSTIGFSEGVYPQEGLRLFDTFILILLLGIVDGMRTNYLMRIPGVPSLISDSHEVFHVGGTTVRSISHLQNPSAERFRLRGSYFWYRVLEAHQEDDLKFYYKEKYGNLSSAEILNRVPGSKAKLGEEFFRVVERIVN